MGLFDFLKPVEDSLPLVSSDLLARSKNSSDRRVPTGHGRCRRSQGLNMSEQPHSQKLLDEETGKNYFWNTETGETTWDSPLVEKTGDTRQTEALPFPVDLLAGTYLEGRQLSCIFQASRDGWSASKFHSLCDNRGPCVVYCETEQGSRFGAFNPDGWCSDDDYRYNLNTFLFFWPAKDGAGPVKLPKVGGGDTALFDYARSGPHFGADGLVIGAGQAAVTGLFAGPDFSDSDKTQGQLKDVISRLGQSYARIPKEFGQTSILGGDRESARLAEMKVYAAPELF
ncbi:hypothetical protein GUITHDRAFT_99219 [Guillardia theta CCMP2712]|uniref:WW domain-containing protein n=1 Tax=Guillardia theta (strain CCMP2712) TaxID=905079 RepID=L1K4D2_GUITC|nr:hypothetical protein GUITHDRAFT_99219 [Guillardia theta CCMP2712]EKX55442.1 hypothetical protein GUITHDRAFT_99219 [Guillardia theta CCMP2712]|eukprot:XP_005842422.1 hypothetical protein GUITHDRAFT_99219 [Guillardia theta CCMP2712]